MTILTDSKILDLAKRLHSAVLERREVDRLSLELGTLSVPDAYRIQDALAELKKKSGEKFIGFKMGLTSKAKMKQMGVEEPIFGFLTAPMQLASGATFKLESGIHPKIEPEIAFYIDKDLRGNVSAAEALAACSGVVAAMEIIDSRYTNFNFTLPDVIADNCSGSFYVVGDTVVKPKDIDLENLGMVMEVNGKGVQFGSSNAILGHPIESLRALCHMLSARGAYIPAGSFVLAGAATQAIALEAKSKVESKVQNLGSVVLNVL